MAVRVRVLLGLLLVLTAMQLPRWASDVALWSAAVEASDSPRATLNLAIALRKQGRYEGALWRLHQTLERAQGHPMEARYRSAVSSQIAYLEFIGIFPCNSPSLSALC